MNDEEIMRKFNETFSEQPLNQNSNQQEDVAPYRATTNLNTANNFVNHIPNNNVPSGQTTEKLEIKDLLSSDKTVYSSYSYSDVENMSDNQYQSNVNYNYVATNVNANTKPKKATVKLSQENLIFLAIIAILFIFILIIPIIYDIIRQIKMI